MTDNKNTLIIIIAAIVFLVLGIFLGSFLIKPSEVPVEIPEKAEESEELWFAYNLSGQVTEAKDNIVSIKGNIKDWQGNPIYRKAFVGADTAIILREKEDVSTAERTKRQTEAFQEFCDYMQSIDWDSEVHPWTLLGQFEEDQPTASPIPTNTFIEKKITLTEIKPGDKISVSSNTNIAANLAFEATAIYIDR